MHVHPTHFLYARVPVVEEGGGFTENHKSRYCGCEILTTQLEKNYSQKCEKTLC